MNTKLIKVISIIFETLLCFAIVAICVMGILHYDTTDNFARFVEAGFRCFSVWIFSIIYYTSLTSDSGADSLFIPYYLISFIISEIRILGTFSDSFTLTIIPPMTGIAIFIGSVVFMCLSLLGYGIYYENRNYESVSKYQTFSLGASVLFAVIIPKVSDYYAVVELLPVRILFSVLIIFTAVVFLILILNDSHSSDIIRHVAALLLIAGNFTNLFFDSYIMNLAATIFTFVGLLIITILVKVNQIKF